MNEREGIDMYYKRPHHPIRIALYNVYVTIEWALKDFFHALFTKKFWEGVAMWALLGAMLLAFEFLFLMAIQGK